MVFDRSLEVVGFSRSLPTKIFNSNYNTQRVIIDRQQQQYTAVGYTERVNRRKVKVKYLSFKISKENLINNKTVINIMTILCQTYTHPLYHQTTTNLSNQRQREIKHNDTSSIIFNLILCLIFVSHAYAIRMWYRYGKARLY